MDSYDEHHQAMATAEGMPEPPDSDILDLLPATEKDPSDALAVYCAIEPGVCIQILEFHETPEGARIITKARLLSISYGAPFDAASLKAVVPND